MTRSPHRYDLDGKPAGEVSAEHRQVAADELARRRTLHQAKVEQAEEGRRMRAGLLRDYERTTLTPANFCALRNIAPEALDALLQTARDEARQAPPAAAPPRHAQQRRPEGAPGAAGRGEGRRRDERQPGGGSGGAPARNDGRRRPRPG